MCRGENVMNDQLLHYLNDISLAQLYRSAVDTYEDKHPSVLAISMAMELLFLVFGKEWVFKNVLSASNYNLIKTDPEKEFSLMNRNLMLAEGLFNLKAIEGISNLLNKAYSDSIDSVIAEIESGRLFLQRGLTFRFVSCSGIKRSDFDIHIFDGDYEVFCETKCRLETSSFSQGSLRNTLDKAKKQLPTNNPAIVLIKTPNNWKESRPLLEKTIYEFVNQTKRPIGVICWSEQWIRITNDERGKFILGIEVHNNQSKLYNAKLIPFLPEISTTPNWTEFGRYASGLL